LKGFSRKRRDEIERVLLEEWTIEGKEENLKLKERKQSPIARHKKAGKNSDLVPNLGI
jgi:hypothetical protein